MASPEEMAELTGQMRQRTEDLQAFMRSVGSWQEEMDAKDEQLRRKAKVKASSTMTTHQQTSKRRSSEEERDDGKTTKQPKEQRISSYDYDRWDRFDVEDALKKLDHDEAEENESEEEEDEEVETARLMQQAVELKERGNEHFR